jgi:hypothetical protein
VVSIASSATPPATRSMYKNLFNKDNRIKINLRRKRNNLKRNREVLLQKDRAM